MSHYKNIGTQGVQELFFGENKSLEVVNNACQSMVLPVWSTRSDWSVSLNGIGCTIHVKFVIGHRSVLIHLLLVVRSPFVSFIFVLDKLFIRHRASAC